MVSLLFIYVWPVEGLSCSYVLHFYPIHPSLLKTCLDFIFHSMQFLILVDLKSTPLFFLFAPSVVLFLFFLPVLALHFIKIPLVILWHTFCFNHEFQTPVSYKWGNWILQGNVCSLWQLWTLFCIFLMFWYNPYQQLRLS